MPGKGALGTWRSSVVNDASRKNHDLKNELRGKPEWAGVYVSERLSLARIGKTSWGNAKAKTGIGQSDLPGLQGGLGKRDAGGNVHPPRNRKGGAGNPPPYRWRARALSRPPSWAFLRPN